MPQIPVIVPTGVPKDAYRVLVTGFGPFANYAENPSWLAVKALQNVILEPATESAPVTIDDVQVVADATTKPAPRPIHVSAVYVPVTYDFVLSNIPGLHSRPPVLPAAEDEGAAVVALPPPPADGYDLVLHVGAGLRGNLRVEKRAHKLGYKLPDVAGKLAPVVETREPGGASKAEDEAERFERVRSALANGAVDGEEVVRGFAAGYEGFAEELDTEIDVDGLVQRLMEVGVDQVQASTNAGRYLCDFTYYCSLAESLRARKAAAATGNTSFKPSRVLFMHCPPVGEPLQSAYVTNAIRRILMDVCEQDK